MRPLSTHPLLSVYDSRTEKDIIHLMIKYVHAVKEELRQFSRPLRGIGAVHFAFR